ncbi:blue copper protein 1a-like [Arachis duranensis]|uniref:Blue copper protein 1a-like n=1 Tax=Arachis duranensis TaxID=130453 RepID=A0A6P4DBC6_ARADU|nr:blue copper protein 1a-like [Arachis duranensis]
MALSRFLAMFLVVAVSIIPIISSTDFIVGDDNGWATGFDYQAWAQGKEFHVGDKLVFKYTKGKHNVMRVNSTGFQQCAVPPDSSTQGFTTGNDVIVLSSPGRKWYICGISNHCENGKMKLAITVQPQIGLGAPTSSPNPTPTPISDATGTSPIYSSWIVIIFALLIAIMF